MSKAVFYWPVDSLAFLAKSPFEERRLILADRLFVGGLESPLELTGSTLTSASGVDCTPNITLRCPPVIRTEIKPYKGSR